VGFYMVIWGEYKQQGGAFYDRRYNSI